MKKRYWQWFCLLLCGIMVLAGCDTEQTEESERAERSLFAMNTYMTFTAYGEEAGAALDAATGYPAENGLQSVVIVGTEGRMCDALSTALFVMGAEQAEAYWRENGGFDMLLITEEGEILITEGIAEQFALNEGRTETIRVLKA